MLGESGSFHDFPFGKYGTNVGRIWSSIFGKTNVFYKKDNNISVINHKIILCQKPEISQELWEGRSEISVNKTLDSL